MIPATSSEADEDARAAQDADRVAGAAIGSVTSVAAVTSAGWGFRGPQGLAYGALGAPLAFVALPLYVVLPNHYATTYGVPLAALGGVLLAARLFDALIDPWMGRLADALFARGAARAWWAVAVGALLLALGFRALFFPPVEGTAALLAWCAAGLAVTYAGYSAVAIVHQSWGARLGGDAVQRARIVAWREGLSLLGVIAASVLPAVAGLNATSGVFTLLLLAGVLALRAAPRPAVGDGAANGRMGHGAAAPRRRQDEREASGPGRDGAAANGAVNGSSTRGAGRRSANRRGGSADVDGVRPASLRLPFASPAFRSLLAIYLANGIASAVPATLVLFFIRDRLEAASAEPLFLASYFAAAALSIPAWVRAVRRVGLARAWLAGMLLAIVVFVWAAALGPGDRLAFTAVCVASGIALGADLTLPGALLAGVIQRAGHAGRAEGAYFGWWNFATKLNLALAAGLALPALQWFGYAPGARGAPALAALTAAYCLLPCVLKLVAAGLLYRHWVRGALGADAFLRDSALETPA